MENNPLYASVVSILLVFLLFFIIIGNLWTIEAKYYSMSNPHEGYLDKQYVASEGKIDEKIVTTYGTSQINTQYWNYNYDTQSYEITGYREIRTPRDIYIDSENLTEPVYILNQDVDDIADLVVYIDHDPEQPGRETLSYTPSTPSYSLMDVNTRLSEDLEIDNTTIRVDSTEYFLVQDEQEDKLTFTIGNEKVDCETKNEIEFTNCKRGIDSTAPSTHLENSLVTQAGKRKLSLNIVVYSGEVVEVEHPVEYYYETVQNTAIPTTINTVDFGDYNTTYNEHNIYTGEDSSTVKITDNVHLAINLSQLFFTITMFMLLCLYFKIKIQFFDPEIFRTAALMFGVISILLAVGAGIYFLNGWPSAYEDDTKKFEQNNLEKSIWSDGRYDYSVSYSQYSFDRCTVERTVTNSDYDYLNNGNPYTNSDCEQEIVNFNQERYIEYKWGLTSNWLLLTLLIPLLGLLCLFLVFNLDVVGYYSSSTSIDSMDEFMMIPDHNDGYHVNFAEALGYGFSVLTNWISYIVAIAAINIAFFFIITWVLLRGTFSSFVIAGVLGFVGFLLNTALLMAVLYKYQSDVGMKASESLVNEGLKNISSFSRSGTKEQGIIPNVAIASVLEKAESKIQKTKKGKGKKGTKTNPKSPQTQDEFDAVPVGTYYVNPSDDKIYKKE